MREYTFMKNGYGIDGDTGGGCAAIMRHGEMPLEEGTVIIKHPGEMSQCFRFPGMRFEGRVAVIGKSDKIERGGPECQHDGSVVCFKHAGKVVVRTEVGLMIYPTPMRIEIRGVEIEIGPGEELDGDLSLVPIEFEAVAVRPSDTDCAAHQWNEACDIDGLPPMPWNDDGTMDCSIGNVFEPPTVPLYKERPTPTTSEQ